MQKIKCDFVLKEVLKIDKYGLLDITDKKIEIIYNPLQMIVNEQVYDLERKEFTNGINKDLYKTLIELRDRGNSLKMRLTEEMKREEWHILCEAYSGGKISINKLMQVVNDFKTVSYNPNNNDKFVASINASKCFIHVHEFKSCNNEYTSKYIHCQYDKLKNSIIHMDYSLNTYTSEQYATILSNPHAIPNAEEHKKIWCIDGNLNIKEFYQVLFFMYYKNRKYIKELFKNDKET